MSKQSNVTVWTCDDVVNSTRGHHCPSVFTRGELPPGWLHLHYLPERGREMLQLYYCSPACARHHLGRLDMEATPGAEVA